MHSATEQAGHVHGAHRVHEGRGTGDLSAHTALSPVPPAGPFSLFRLSLRGKTSRGRNDRHVLWGRSALSWTSTQGGGRGDGKAEGGGRRAEGGGGRAAASRWPGERGAGQGGERGGKRQVHAEGRTQESPLHGLGKAGPSDFSKAV